MAGSAVLRMVPSSACMKKATATSQGSRRAVRASRRAGSAMENFVRATLRTLGRYPARRQRAFALAPGC
ncbi:hypothetical protein D3C80_758210 [compost metagenome]